MRSAKKINNNLSFFIFKLIVVSFAINLMLNIIGLIAKIFKLDFLYYHNLVINHSFANLIIPLLFCVFILKDTRRNIFAYNLLYLFIAGAFFLLFSFHSFDQQLFLNNDLPVINDIFFALGIALTISSAVLYIFSNLFFIITKNCLKDYRNIINITLLIYILAALIRLFKLDALYQDIDQNSYYQILFSSIMPLFHLAFMQAGRYIILNIFHIQNPLLIRIISLLDIAFAFISLLMPLNILILWGQIYNLIIITIMLSLAKKIDLYNIINITIALIGFILSIYLSFVHKEFFALPALKIIFLSGLIFNYSDLISKQANFQIAIITSFLYAATQLINILNL